MGTQWPPLGEDRPTYPPPVRPQKTTDGVRNWMLGLTIANTVMLLYDTDFIYHIARALG